MKPDDWIAQFAATLGVKAPTAAQTEELLELARIAAHASERTAAPIACWLAGHSGRAPGELLEAAARIGDDA